jgi:glycosyltransferase involved in cell wall biosynthesis
MDKAFCRGLLQLPQDRTLMLFGAMGATSDPRKGFPYLQSALKKLAEDDGHENIELLVFGASAPSNPPDLGFPVHYLGWLHDDATMVALYSAADVVIAPSNEDNLPNVVLEALACGTPCVAFDIGGLPDMIDHQQNGYLAVPFKSEDLALGISWVLKDDERRRVLSANARAKVEAEFELSKVSLRYRSLYEELLTR